jgi:hypothetical protein
MPNWCSNTVIIQGEPGEVQQLLDSVEDSGTAFSLDKVIAMPNALRGQSAPERDEDAASTNMKLYGAKDWYDWSNLNWGTKWNVDANIVYDNGKNNPLLNQNRTVRIQFESAWAPPLPVYEVLAARWPNTNIYVAYDEPGSDFAGYVMYTKGRAVKEGNFSSPSGQMNYVDPPSEEDVFTWFPDEENYEEVGSYVEAAKIQHHAMKARLEAMASKLR